MIQFIHIQPPLSFILWNAPVAQCVIISPCCHVLVHFVYKLLLWGFTGSTRYRRPATSCTASVRSDNRQKIKKWKEISMHVWGEQNKLSSCPSSPRELPWACPISFHLCLLLIDHQFAWISFLFPYLFLFFVSTLRPHILTAKGVWCKGDPLQTLGNRPFPFTREKASLLNTNFCKPREEVK